MAYYEITNFAPGLDSRRSELTSKPGTLETLNNAHINEGSEIQKRMEFSPIYLPSGSFGLQPLVNGLQVFGSGTTPAGFPVSFTNPAGSQSISYQQLTSPNTGSSSMTAVVSSTLFANQAWVAATFADNYTYSFYASSLVPDFTNGLVESWQSTTAQIAAALVTQINFTGSASNSVQGEPVYTATINGSTVNIFSTATPASTTPYVVTAVVVTASSGAITPTLINTGVLAVAAVQATGSFSVTAGLTATQATGSATITTNPHANDTLTIGTVTYTFVSSLTNTTPNQIFIGAANTNTATNLNAAIMNNGTPGTQYSSATVANPSATSTVSTNVVSLTAIVGGTPGNSIALSTVSGGRITVSGANLSGGTNNNAISQVNVGSTNLLSSTVPFNQSVTQTAIDLVTNINANNTGFIASATAGAVTITGPVLNANTYNGLPVSVVQPTGSQVAIQLMSFTLSNPTANSGAVSSITIGGGSNIMTATITFQDGGHPGETVAAFCERIATNVSANSGTSGYTGVANGTVIYISPLTSTSTTTPGAMVVTTSGTITFGTGSATNMAVGLSSNNITGRTNTSGGYTSASAGPVTATGSGGNPPYTYAWTFVSSTSAAGQLLFAVNATSPSTTWRQLRSVGSLIPFSETWVCTATDSTGLAHASSANLVINIP